MLTKTHLLSFKEKITDGNYENPTEVIPMTACQTVKSAEDSANFVKDFRLELLELAADSMPPSWQPRPATGTVAMKICNHCQLVVSLAELADSPQESR